MSSCVVISKLEDLDHLKITLSKPTDSKAKVVPFKFNYYMVEDNTFIEIKDIVFTFYEVNLNGLILPHKKLIENADMGPKEPTVDMIFEKEENDPNTIFYTKIMMRLKTAIISYAYKLEEKNIREGETKFIKEIVPIDDGQGNFFPELFFSDGSSKILKKADIEEINNNGFKFFTTEKSSNNVYLVENYLPAKDKNGKIHNSIKINHKFIKSTESRRQIGSEPPEHMLDPNWWEIVIQEARKDGTVYRTVKGTNKVNDMECVKIPTATNFFIGIAEITFPIAYGSMKNGCSIWSTGKVFWLKDNNKNKKNSKSMEEIDDTFDQNDGSKMTMDDLKKLASNKKSKAAQEAGGGAAAGGGDASADQNDGELSDE